MSTSALVWRSRQSNGVSGNAINRPNHIIPRYDRATAQPHSIRRKKGKRQAIAMASDTPDNFGRSQGLNRRLSKGPRCIRVALACAFSLSIVAPAHAADVKGAWVADVSLCSRAFERKDNTIVIYDAGAFVIDDKSIRGKSATCEIKARNDDAQFVRLLVTCPADIAESQFNLRIDSANKLTRIFPGMPQMNKSYVRCRL